MKTNCRFINNHLTRCLLCVLAPGSGGVAIMMMAVLWLLGVGSVAHAADSFSMTSSLITGRHDHTATLLNNGKVLVAGGNASGSALSSTELYDPATGKWTATGSLTKTRYSHTATLLPNGKVLIVGGYGAASYTSAELYDPTSGTWTATGSLTVGRYDHTATLLPNGKVLVVGGNYANTSSASAELYNPATGTWQVTGSLASGRRYHTATLLPSGKVLVAGGLGNNGYLASAELYDPAAGTWAQTGNFANARSAHATILLPNGKVLIAGGFNGSSLTSAELYDPAAGTWSSSGSLITARHYFAATLLPDGKVLIAGGLNPSFLASAELYDPLTATWTSTASLTTARPLLTATLLPSGAVLFAGGGTSNGGGAGIATAELYQSVNGSWLPTASLANVRESHTTTLLPDGKVLVAGGKAGVNYLASAELYNPATGTWTTTGNLGTARSGHRAVLLSNGLVLVIGGYNGAILASTELYNPTTGTWTATGSLTTSRSIHTATLLADGRVLVVGGVTSGSDLSSAEIYNPMTGVWSLTASLATARGLHTATLLADGRVLVTGGKNGQALSSAEIYSLAGTWSAAGNLTAASFSHTATLLPNGKVLVAGGYNGNSLLNSSQLYDPVTGTWTATGSVATGRSGHTALVLPNGKVLIAGGTSNGDYTSAELYDPAFGTWAATGAMASGRLNYSVTLLPNGKVLVTGGNNGSSSLASAELFDTGLAFAPSRQPQISGAFVNANQRLVLTGTGFTGDSEASGGGTTNSASNYPVVQVRSLANERSVFIGPSAATNWSATTFTTGNLSVIPEGFALATVFTNGIPSSSTIFNTIIPTGPTVFGISPNKGGTAGGTSVTITGSNFTGATGVTIGGVAATGVIVVNSTTITCTTPAGAVGSASVIVIAPVGSSTANSLFTYVVPPTVATIVPDSGTAAGGASVTVFGANFTGATGVTIGGTAATNVVVVNDSTISCTTPAGVAGTASVLVTNPAGANAANTLYTYIATPIVDEISPFTGTADGGTVVTITGTNFTGTTGVTIGGTPATNVNVINTTTITCTTPAGAEGAASVIVANLAGGNAANALYTYASPTGIAVKGNTLNIVPGDTIPSASDGSDFGVVPVLSALLPHSFAIFNTGGLPLHLIGSSAVSISGPAADDFEVVTLPSTTVSVGRSNPFAISFQPTAPGLRTATVTIASDSPATPSFTFAIAGYGTLAKNFVNAIAFTPPSTLYLAQSPFTLSASASSNLPVTLNLVPPFPAGTTLVGDVLTVTTAGSVKVQATCAASGIFNAAVPVLKTITVKANPSALTLINLAQVYDGSPKPIATLGGAATITYKVGTTFIGTPPSAAGSYPVKAVGATTVTGTLVIAKAPLVVTPDNKFKLAGRANPALTASYSGFLNGDSLSNITAPVLKTTATLTSPTGTYPIIASGGAAANYRFVFLPGTLAVGSFAGSYEALLLDGNSSPSGKLSITVAANATNSFTGKLYAGTEVTPLAITGTLNTNTDTQHATSDVYRFSSNGVPYAVSIDVSVFGSAPMSVTVLRDNQLLGSTTRGRKLSNATVFYAGAHTAVFEPGGSGSPTGAGWATANISSTGVLTLSGRLGDDTAFTAALSPDREIRPGYRLFAQPYLAARTQSFIAGDFALAPYPGLANRLYLAQKSLTWQKLGLATDTSYRAGFGPVTTVLMIDPWLPPVAGTTLAQRLGLAGNSFGITTSDPTSASAVNLPSRLSLSATNKVSVLTPLANLTKWKTLTFNPINGTFTGSFELVDGGVKRTPTFSGILRRPASGADILIGDGHYMLAPLSGTEKTTGEVMFTRP